MQSLQRRLADAPSTSGRHSSGVKALLAPCSARRINRARGDRSIIVCYAQPGAVVEQASAPALPKPLPRAVENAADDPSLHNPLQRMERLGTGWFGVIAEFEGVVVEDTLEAHKRAWLMVAEEMGLQRPLGQTMQRVKGMRDEVVIMQLFNWTRDPRRVASIRQRKDELYDELMNGVQPAEVVGSRAFFDTLRNYKVPIVLATAAPESRVRPALAALDIAHYFDGIVTGEDSGAPELEFYYMMAAAQLGRPAVRCIVLGDSNRSVEAARELGMKSVIVAGSQPTWDFGNADLVARNLDALSMLNLKKLFGNENLVEALGEGGLEPELEPEPEPRQRIRTATLFRERD